MTYIDINGQRYAIAAADFHANSCDYCEYHDCPRGPGAPCLEYLNHGN